MSMSAEWETLAQRVSALRDAGNGIFAPSSAQPNGFNLIIQRALYPQLVSARDDLLSFLVRWRSHLSSASLAFITSLTTGAFAEDVWDPNSLGNTPEGWRVIGARALAAVDLVRAAIAQQFNDPSLQAIGITERAIKHLQWMIVSDSDIAAKWQAAYSAGEPACERIGATHLLLHGVWAYKAHSATERTDLVLCEPIEDRAELRRAARALVLTEWKRATSNEQAVVLRAASGGKKQARIYAGELLAGFDLRTVRYIIIVTKDRSPIPGDEVIGDVTYRYLNIAVAPSAPSS